MVLNIPKYLYNNIIIFILSHHIFYNIIKYINNILKKNNIYIIILFYNIYPKYHKIYLN